MPVYYYESSRADRPSSKASPERSSPREIESRKPLSQVTINRVLTFAEGNRREPDRKRKVSLFEGLFLFSLLVSDDSPLMVRRVTQLNLENCQHHTFHCFTCFFVLQTLTRLYLWMTSVGDFNSYSQNFRRRPTICNR